MFALITPDLTGTGKRKAQIVPPGPVPNHPEKPYWVQIVEEIDDTSGTPERVISPWVETVEVARLLRTRTIRDKTTGELDAEDQARVDRLLLESGVVRALALMMFELGKAGKTGDWSFFDDVADKPTFKTLLMSVIR